jgi:S-methylmethionine-dependent homocysteine/selenocysteine methylase
MAFTILDGPMGTALAAAGVPTPAPRWSAAALVTHPHAVSAVHAAQAAAGVDVLTANTFRTTRRAWGPGWRAAAREAVGIARGAAPPGVRVAGSIAPLEDCYRPDLSPEHPGREHALLAGVLAEAGCDLLLCETFPHAAEALAAVRAGVSTGVPTWLALTAGPDADLLSPEAMGRAARAAVDAGAEAVLVNCVPAARTRVYVEALSGCGVPFGAYANAGAPAEGMGWGPAPSAGGRYLSHCRAWVDAGATLLGACCGTTLGVTEALVGRYGSRASTPAARPD